MAVHAEAFSNKLDFEPYGSYYMGEDSEDDNIWSCLDIMPTPPLSPARQQYITDTSSNYLADKLLQVTENLDFDNALIDMVGDTNSIFNGGSKLRSSLIQDCMWNAGICETDKKNLVNTNVSAFDTPCATPPRAEEFISTSDCVDPIAVFPYTLSDQGQQQFVEAQSDSEEEIDVVTVEKPNKRKLSSIELPQQHKVTEDLQSPTKRAKSPQISTKGKEACSPKGGLSVKPDIDNDVKRATHNVLERKRRNDLRYSFQTLRDQIPDLEDNERAPKVNILKKSTEYIKFLKEEESKLISMKETERERRKALLAKIDILKSKRN
ncbi:Transcriptional regulator Myc-1 [Trichoplax sp. H2]|uniref:BHLH domain-containing protein n=1 Tax=Trichoplax adhaerens TaxID=10228 RepID=B3S238_TRIAD|nr:hypothetical protein TRIADDRAFT_57914 [Trichoplax adhaerens]EDV23047.1 hypothetical protein TRIADDRAFT_57914 [Trichoplax adhaerens]RDD46205.1 Transcriptional regulator Myc-1 [Trichoplax sp. H2]|eukprot:XP_002113957.1 hypothetical protein TRIADDRAFT_57914 [Trichoplax adhaerens]